MHDYLRTLLRTEPFASARADRIAAGGDPAIR